MALAEKGDSCKVDIMSNDLVQKKSDKTEDLYTAFMDVENDFLIYSLGKGVGKTKGFILYTVSYTTNL